MELQVLVKIWYFWIVRPKFSVRNSQGSLILISSNLALFWTKSNQISWRVLKEKYFHICQHSVFQERRLKKGCQNICVVTNSFFHSAAFCDFFASFIKSKLNIAFASHLEVIFFGTTNFFVSQSNEWRYIDTLRQQYDWRLSLSHPTGLTTRY